MSKYLKVEGTSLEEVRGNVERILQRMSRRLQKTIVGVVPPSVVFSSEGKASEDGTVLRFVVPANGRIEKVCVMLNDFANKDVVAKLNFEIKTTNKTETISIETKKNVVVKNTEVIVITGDLATISLVNPESVGSVFATVLYYIDLNKSKTFEVAIDQIEEALEISMEKEG